MSEQVSSARAAMPGGAQPMPAAVAAVLLGIAAISVTIALSIKAGPVAFVVPAVLGIGLVVVLFRKLALFGTTYDGTIIAMAVALGLSALFAFSGQKVAADQKQREIAAQQIVALGRTDPAAQQVRLGKLDEPMLKALGKVAPALEAQERRRRAEIAQKEQQRVQAAAADEKRRKIANLEERLTSLSKTDYEGRAAALNELHELAPERPEYGQRALELAAQIDKERAVREHPESSLMMSNLSWGKGGFGTIMLLNVDVKNVSALTLRDFTIECTNMGPSGTALNTNSQVVYEQIGPGQTKRLRRFNMGFMANQAEQTSCQITGAEVVG